MSGGGSAEADRVPTLGELARDIVHDRVGIVVVRTEDIVRLRSLSGGPLWEAVPGNVRRLSAQEELSARLAVANAGQRWGKCPGIQ